jgi:double-stranded uracil-DNA glycosylase
MTDISAPGTGPTPGPKARPTSLDLEAARDRTLPDVLPEPGAPFRVLFCGINPGLYSAATGWHFARPGNRFWPAMQLSGFTPRRLAAREQDVLPGLGLGITNLVAPHRTGGRAVQRRAPGRPRAPGGSRRSPPAALRRHRRRHRLPHRIRPAPRRYRSAAGLARPRPAVGCAQSQRPQRTLFPGGARGRVRGPACGRRRSRRGLTRPSDRPAAPSGKIAAAIRSRLSEGGSGGGVERPPARRRRHRA